MASFKVTGGSKLSGTIIPQGAKNEAMQVLCAALLTDEPVTITNLPNILDINNLIDLMRGMGVDVDRKSPSEVTLQAKNINHEYFDTKDFHERATKLRGSVMILGPLLARFGMGSCHVREATRSAAVVSTHTSSA